MHHVENRTFVAEALGTTPRALVPVQFPYTADSPCMALAVPRPAKSLLEKVLLL